MIWVTGCQLGVDLIGIEVLGLCDAAAKQLASGGLGKEFKSYRTFMNVARRNQDLEEIPLDSPKVEVCKCCFCEKNMAV